MDETRARSVQIQGRSLRVFEAGDGDPVILLHGGGADSSVLSWGDVFDPLSRHVHLYAFDWPGYGRSEPIEGVLTGERLVDTLEALINHLSIARVNLAGISMGGEAALGYALRHQERVRRLVLIGCGGLQERAPYHAIAWPLLHLPLVAKPMLRWQWRVFATRPRLLERSLRSLLPSWDTIPGELVRMIQDELTGRPKPEVFSEWQADEVRFRGLKTNWTPDWPSCPCR